MATPHVSGAAALVLAKCTLDTAALRSVLLNNVELVGGLTGKVATGGRLNVDAAIRSCANLPPPLPPDAPTLTLTPGNAQIALSWTQPSGANSYTIKRGTSPGATTTTVATGLTGSTYTNTGLTNDTKYYYIVLAVNAGGSTPSAEQSATPLGPPAVPTGLTATSGPDNGQISLKWNASSGATSYTIQRGTSSFGSLTTIATGVTGTTYVNTGLKRGRRYYYVVAAVNGAGSSANTARVNTTAK